MSFDEFKSTLSSQLSRISVDFFNNETQKLFGHDIDFKKFEEDVLAGKFLVDFH